MIAKAQNAETFRLHYRAARPIGELACIGVVMPAIKFDNEPGCVTNKIGNVICDRNLSAKSKPVQPMIP